MATNEDFSTAELTIATIRAVGQWAGRDMAPDAVDVPDHPSYWLGSLDGEQLLAVLVALWRLRDEILALFRGCSWAREDSLLVAREMVGDEILGRMAGPDRMVGGC